MQANALTELGPGLRHDPVLGVKRTQLGSGGTRVQLHLVEVGRDARLDHDPFEMADLEVRGPDRPPQPLLPEADEPLPSLDVTVLGWIRPVDHEAVEIVDAES